MASSRFAEERNLHGFHRTDVVAPPSGTTPAASCGSAVSSDRTQHRPRCSTGWARDCPIASASHHM